MTSDERRLNGELQLESNEHSEKNSLQEKLVARENLEEYAASTEYFRERIFEYAKNGELEPELQRKVEELKGPRFGIDKGVSYVLCFEILCNLCGKVLKALRGEIPPTEECKNILVDTIECVDRVLTFSVGVECFKSNVDTLQSILRKINWIPLDSPSRENWPEVQYEMIREELETWLDEYESLIDVYPQKEGSQRSGIGQTDYYFFVNNSLRYSRIVDDWLSRESTTCRFTFGSKYAKFDDLERFFENKSTVLESVCELSSFLENPPDRKIPSDKAKEWALARLYDSLTRYPFFGKLKECPTFILDRHDLRKRRDKHICKAMLFETTVIFRDIEWIVRIANEEYRRQKKLAETMKQVTRRGEFKSHFSGGFIEESYSEPNVLLDRLRNTVLLYCYLALADLDEKPIEKITATVGATCLNPTEFEKTLAGKISFKETLVKAQERGRMLNCACAVVFLASHSHQVGYFVEKLLSETEWGTESEVVKTEFYDCLNKLAGEEGIPHTRSLAAATSRFGTFVNNFTHLPEGETVSKVAKKYIDLIEKFALSPWYDGMIISLNELKERLIPLREYDTIKRFESKSRMLEDLVIELHSILDKFRGPCGSICSELCYYRFLKDLSVYIEKISWNLCLTTQPRLILGDAKSVEVRRKNDSELIVGVPVSNVSDEYAQSALDVRLIIEDSTNAENTEDGEIKDHNPPKFVLIEPPHVVEILPSGGRTETMEFTLRLLEPCDILPVRFQLKYKYKKRIEYWSDIPYPRMIDSGKMEWLSYDIAIPGGKATKKKHELRTGRLNALGGGNGGVEFETPGVKELLNNRRKEVDEAIGTLIVEDKTDSGEITSKLASSGRLVIVYGQWRVGKTVIYELINKRLCHDFPDVVTLKISFLELSENENFESDLSIVLLTRLEDYLRNNKSLFGFFQETLGICHIDLYSDENVRWHSFTRFLKLFIAKIRDEVNPDLAVVLLVDEFTAVYPRILDGSVNSNFLSRWVQMINTTNLLCVAVGGEHTWDMFETYSANTGQKAKHVFVDYLSELDVEKYVRYVLYESPEDKIASEDSYFQEETKDAIIERIYGLTGGNPFLLCNFCEWLIKWLKASEVPFLTITTINDAIDFKLKEGTDKGNLVHTLFHSLFNPFNEVDKKKEIPNVIHIHDDRVRDDNETILDAIVELANPITHCCVYDELSNLCNKNGMDEDTFKRRFNSLVSRNVVKKVDGTVWVFVDLYYEIKTRIKRIYIQK